MFSLYMDCLRLGSLSMTVERSIKHFGVSIPSAFHSELKSITF